MPRYHYKCSLCESEVSVIHCFDDVYTECEKCESTGSMHKMITRPNIKVNNSDYYSNKVGNLTKEYIEINREILKKQKSETNEST